MWSHPYAKGNALFLCVRLETLLIRRCAVCGLAVPDCPTDLPEWATPMAHLGFIALAPCFKPHRPPGASPSTERIWS